jgi:bacillithiol biosynthesis cysteine-adding enzyme BshC
VPFSALPHQSKLFLDYLRDPVSLQKYYPNAVASHAEVSAFIPEVLANYKTDRTALCDALDATNSDAGAGERTFANIGLLRDADTVAVVTGQQSGLFTGPLYTIYKALSAIKMADYLNANGSKAVPVFWVASEDHDFDEVSHTTFIGNAGDLIDASYRPAEYVKSSPVGNVEIDGSIAKVIDDVFSALPHTEFSSDVRQSVEKAWLNGTRFANAFDIELAHILKRFGLVFIDPMHPGIRSLAAPIYAEAIERSDEIVTAIRRKNSELEADGYHAQVLVEPDYFPLFRIDGQGRRVTLRKTGDDHYISNEEKTGFTKADLAAMARDTPQCLSPGVMLRPVVQDFLLPTVCYFGGAAEIAYFAQNSEVYRILDRPVTPILHRRSFTVVESKHRRTLEKFDLELTDMFAGVQLVLESVGMKQLSSETSNILSEAEHAINTELDKLGKNFAKIDATLAASLAKRRRKMLHHIAALKKSASLAEMRKDETTERQIRSAFSSILPKGELQERIINVNSFSNKYGPHFIDLIYDACDLAEKDHRIIDL